MSKSLEMLKFHANESEHIANRLSSQTNPEATYVLIGSMSRALGPYADVDLLVVQDDMSLRYPKGSVFDIPIYAQHFQKRRFSEYLRDDPRGWLTAHSGRVLEIGNSDDGTPEAISAQREKLQGPERHSLLALLLAEQAGDTARRDLLVDGSRFARKRHIAGKRSTTRTLLIAEALQPEPTLSNDPVDKFAGLLDYGLIDEEVVDSMFAINTMLANMKRHIPIINSEWEQHAEVTGSWVKETMEKAQDVDAQNPDINIDSFVRFANSDRDADHSFVLDRLKLPMVSVVFTHTVLWRLLANPNLGTENLRRVWQQLDEIGSGVQALGATVIGHEAYTPDVTTPGSPLLQNYYVRHQLLQREKLWTRTLVA